MRSVLTLAIALSACGDQTADGPIFLQDRHFNIAHRGGALLAPEETLEAYHNAIAVGADALEMDVWSTADDVLVLMHDDTVDRTTDGTGAVHDMTWSQLSALDAGYHFTPDDGATFPYRGQGVGVARLDDVLAAFPDALFSIEIKQDSPSIVGRLVDAIYAADAADRAVVGSFDADALIEFRVAAPEITTTLSLPESLEFYALTAEEEETWVPPGEVLAAPKAVGDPATLARAERVGLAVQVWTINERSDMEELLDLGVKGIITDDPATFEDLLTARGVAE